MNMQSIIKMMTDVGIELNEAKKEIEMLLEHFFSYTTVDKIQGKNLNDMQLDMLKKKVQERVSDRKPIQHIIGEAYFMGEYFKVSPDVLIPRDETEILVRKAIELINKNNFEQVLDIGTGSGCIACTIAKQTNAVVLGVDISFDALRVALDNVTKLGINNRAVFRKSDLFEKIHPNESFDLIISNPPYIPTGTKLSPEVMHEPEIALFAGDDGLDVYRKIIEDAPKYINKGGYLMFELGIDESNKVKELMQKKFKDIVVLKDMAGIDRVIYAQLV
ncbi:MAG: peptide chain release factor N(5)-glutamine methyltransferase [bacterium]|nr:peptide chain release factor N(5)-glutamine methyltransferase [bacterium]